MYMHSFAGTQSLSPHSIGLSFPRPLNRCQLALAADVDIASRVLAKLPGMVA